MNKRNEAENKPGKQCGGFATEMPFNEALQGDVVACAIGGPKIPPYSGD